MIFIPPEMPKPVPAPAMSAAPVDCWRQKLITVLSQHGDEPVPVWSVVHQIIQDEAPVSRAHRGQLRVTTVLKPEEMQWVVTLPGQGKGLPPLPVSVIGTHHDLKTAQLISRQPARSGIASALRPVQ